MIKKTLRSFFVMLGKEKGKEIKNVSSPRIAGKSNI